MEWVYDTTLAPTDCFARLLNPQKQSEDDVNPANAEFTPISETRLYFVYKGRRFSKYRRSEYIMDIYPSDIVSAGTRIAITFCRELFNCPIPMTPIQDLDVFMNEKLNAYRRM